MQERCIGCKTCVVACPYGAMEVVVRPVIRNSGAGLNVRADKAEANKCDLCNHREDGPACMAACPTHALICVDRNKLEQLSAENAPHGADVLKNLTELFWYQSEFPEIFVEYEAGSIADCDCRMRRCRVRPCGLRNS